MTMQTSFIVLFYLLATGALTVNTFRPNISPVLARGMMLICGAIALHIHANILLRMMFTDSGLNLGLLVSISLVSWTVTLIVYLASFYQQTQSLMILLFPLSAVCVIGSQLLDEHRILGEQLTNGLKIHIVLSISAYSLLFIGTLQALLMRYQEKLLLAKKAILVMNILPPLQVMEHLLLRFIIVGFFLLSLSLATGLMFINDMFSQHLVHKTVLSILAWLIYGVLLCGHWFAGWRGKRITRWAVGGFITLLLAYLGTKFVLELVLDRV